VSVQPVAPDAVRVWRGFRAATLALPDFLTRLGSVFVPATVQMQIAVGLHAYVPSVPAGLPGKPETVPDETAILFWESQQTYRDGFGTLAVRTYTLTHGACYTPASRADFPVPFAGELAVDQPYHLLDTPADWMHGQTTHLLLARPAAAAPQAFREEVAALLPALLAEPGLGGAIVCAGADYLALWLLGHAPPDAVSALAAAGEWQHTAGAVPTHLEKGLWEQWAGLPIASGDSLTMQFTRRGER